MASESAQPSNPSQAIGVVGEAGKAVLKSGLSIGINISSFYLVKFISDDQNY
jgi:hypothetical protein